ncbi:EamA family transporter RarD [Comamonas antarctica]|uniref:EamA family transporter RarD n=1 Tax=Comamonas antarctica TaxID=2743470 RepID=UPI0028F08541|nr:EamA family transporter RarD [Comamonas antarctica]
MSTSSSNTPSGVAFNVLASVLFALMYAYGSLLTPLTGEQVFGWRILLTLPCLTLLVLATGYGPAVRALARRIRYERHFWTTRLLSALLLGVQLWLFMWAPINGRGLDVSLGYFLLPISMVLLGRVAFGERLSRPQLLACVLALIGIACQLVLAQTLSWPALLVCLGYPVYFWLRRRTDTNHLAATWLDMALALPASLFFLLQGGELLPHDASAALPWLILGLGALSALALGCQALSMPRLNVTLFGLLIYVEPVLLVVAAVLLGETIERAQWPTYAAIWLAVLVLVAEGALALVSARRAKAKEAGLGRARGVPRRV